MLGTSFRFSASVPPVTVEQSPCNKPASSSALNTAGVPPTLVQIVHDIAAARLEVGQVRHAVAEAVEVRQRPIDSGLARDRHQVQHGVGRAAQGQHQRVGVLQRLAA